MRILLVSESYWPNADGGALFERRLILGLAGLGHHVAVWAPADRFASYTETDGPSTIYRERGMTFLANRKYKVSAWPFWHARRILRTERPDIIHIHNCYRLGWAALLWAKLYRIPVVATNHFMPENALLNLRGSRLLYRPLHRLIWAYLVFFHNRFDYVTSPTPTAVELLVRYGLKAPSRAISNGVDTAVFRPGLDPASVVAKYSIATDRPVILYLGRVDGEKRLDVILDALPTILDQEPVQLVVAGFGKSMDDLKAQAARLKITDAIVFTGYIEEDEKPFLYNAANVFVISSPAELQSIVTLEAMASGLPIVATDVAALKELCHDGENGYLFDITKPKELAQKTLAIITDKGLAKRFSSSSTNFVQKHHSTQVTFETYQAVYQHVLKERA